MGVAEIEVGPTAPVGEGGTRSPGQSDSTVGIVASHILESYGQQVNV